MTLQSKSDYTITIVNELTGERRSITVIGFALDLDDIHETLLLKHYVRKKDMADKMQNKKFNFNYSSEFYRSRSKYVATEKRRMERARARIEKRLPKDFFSNPNERINNDDTD